MKRLISLLLLLSVCLCSCLVKQEEEKVEVKIHVSEPLAQIRYAVAFRKADCDLAKEFDRVLGSVMDDGTAARLCETHINEDLIDTDPIPANVGRGGDGSLERVKEAGKIVIGYHKQYKPMAWIDSSESAVGLDIELAREVGRRMGLTIEFKLLEWSGKDSALAGGSVDAIFCAYEYTEERAEKFNLSRTYFTTSLVLVSHADAPYDSISELADKRVGFCEGTSAEQLLADSEATPMPCSAHSYAYERVRSKQYAALLADRAWATCAEQGLN